MEKFIDFWKRTSPDVEGGVAIWIANRELIKKGKLRGASRGRR
jgi:hypothetical protein